VLLVDANIFMYAGGAEHPHKAAAVAQLERFAGGEEEGAIDAEILQEILHRYRAIGRWREGGRLYDLVRRVIPLVFAIDERLTDRARDLLEQYPHLMARDALHAAVVFEHGLRGICTFDRDFDGIRGLARVEPRLRRR
jgi:uncharacterized protein